MEKINNSLLNDTLKLMQLAREAARQQGVKDQANRLDPVIDRLQTLASPNQETTNESPTGILAQSDFKMLMQVIGNDQEKRSSSPNLQERNKMVNSMSAGGMSELDIAKYLGVSRDEVRTILNLSSIGFGEKR
jgi:hypothetical protein